MKKYYKYVTIIKSGWLNKEIYSILYFDHQLDKIDSFIDRINNSDKFYRFKEPLLGMNIVWSKHYCTSLRKVIQVIKSNHKKIKCMQHKNDPNSSQMVKLWRIDD